MKKFITILLVITGILFTASTFLSAITVKEKSYTEPEDAINVFLDGLKENNLDKCFKSCAVNPYSEKFDFTAFAKRLNAIVFWNTLAPSSYELYRDLNKIEMMARIGRQIRFFYFSILSTEKDYSKTIVDFDDERLENFILTSDPARIKDMQVISIDKPVLVESERYKKMAAKSSLCYGADDATERVVLLKFENDFYVFGFHLLRYGNDWKIDSLSSAIANTPMFGAEKVELDEYKNILE